MIFEIVFFQGRKTLSEQPGSVVCSEVLLKGWEKSGRRENEMRLDCDGQGSKVCEGEHGQL